MEENKLKRVSINVSDINEPKKFSNNLLEPRRSFKASESNDIVPKVKIIQPLDDNKVKSKKISNEEQVDNVVANPSTESTDDDSDSDTPTFQSVLIIFDDKINPIEENVSSDKQVKRISKSYGKAKVKLMDLSSSFSFVDKMSRIETPVTIRDDQEVMDHALGLLQKYNYENTYDIEYTESSQTPLPVLSYDYSFITPSISTTQLLDGTREETFSVPPISSQLTLPKYVNHSFESQRSQSERIQSMNINKTSSFEKRNLSSDRSINYTIGSETKKLGNKTQKQKNGDQYKRVVEPNIFPCILVSDENLKSPDNSKLALIKNLMETNFIRNPNVKTPYINTVRTYTKHVATNFNGKSKANLSVQLEDVTQSELRQFKIVWDKKSFIIPKFENLSEKRTVPHGQHLFLEDIVVLKPGTTISLDDVVDAISKTTILRKFGLTVLPDTTLQKAAVGIIEKKSERLEYFLNKKYPMLQNSICGMINHMNYHRGMNSRHNKVRPTGPTLPNGQSLDVNPYWLDFNSILKRTNLSYFKPVKPIVGATYNSKTMSKYAIYRKQAYQRSDINPCHSRLKNNLESSKKISR